MSSHWSLLATIDWMRDADCLLIRVVDVGFGDSTGSRSRSGLLGIGDVRGERPADDTALSARRESRLSSPCGTARPGGSYRTATENTCSARRCSRLRIPAERCPRDRRAGSVAPHEVRPAGQGWGLTVEASVRGHRTKAIRGPNYSGVRITADLVTGDATVYMLDQFGDDGTGSSSTQGPLNVQHSIRR